MSDTLFTETRENIITTDASKHGLGAILWQTQPDGIRKPIQYASRYLNDAEKRYSTNELELLAVVWGLEHFRFYIYGKPVKLYSDHSALEPLLRRNRANKTYSARLTRWIDRIAHFDVSVNHIAGEEIKLTDYLSRHPTYEAETETNYDEEYVINALIPLLYFNTRTDGLADTNPKPNTTNDKHTRNKLTYANEEQSDTIDSHPTDKIGITSEQTLNTHIPRIKIIQSDNKSCKQSTTEKISEIHKPNTQMDRNNYHWGATSEIMTIIRRRDKSPTTQN